jgi:glucose/arabinose dehydrogenase
MMNSRAAILALMLLAPLPAAAATLPSGFTESVIATGLLRPTAMAFAPDGRLFVCQQGGALRVITAAGTLLATPFTTVTVDANGERGLLGVAFDPAFQSNHFVYIYYTATTPTIHNRVSRFTANGDVAAAGSESVVVDLETLMSATNHNGGAIHFGPDGKLYVAVGENANGSNAQSFGNRLGKVLRIDADGSIPSDNPFFNSATGANRSIFALGLRNPFTFAFQRWTGELFVNDVGAGTWEEINRGVAGANYGWPIVEGAGNNPNFVNPIYAYDHSNGCAISGGAFYSPLTPRFPTAYFGSYFFADHCGGWIRWRSATGTITSFASGISFIVDVAVSLDGRLYYLARGTGTTTGIVSRVDYTGATVLITANGIHGSQTIASGHSLTLTVAFSPGTQAMNPAEVYLGVASQSGTTLWFNPNTNTFGPTAAPGYSGSLAAFGPTNVVFYPDVSVLSPGKYWWLVIVDNDSNGVPNATLIDYTPTIIQ